MQSKHFYAIRFSFSIFAVKFNLSIHTKKNKLKIILMTTIIKCNNVIRSCSCQMMELKSSTILCGLGFDDYIHEPLKHELPCDGVQDMFIKTIITLVELS